MRSFSIIKPDSDQVRKLAPDLINGFNNVLSQNVHIVANIVFQNVRKNLEYFTSKKNKSDPYLNFFKVRTGLKKSGSATLATLSL